MPFMKSNWKSEFIYLHVEPIVKCYRMKEKKRKDIIMARKYIDCREHPSAESNCTLAISADNENEIIEAAVQHGVAAHGMQDGPELREQLKTMIKEGSPS